VVTSGMRVNKAKVKSFPSHVGPVGGSDLRFVALSQTPNNTARPLNRVVCSKLVPTSSSPEEWEAELAEMTE